MQLCQRGWVGCLEGSLTLQELSALQMLVVLYPLPAFHSLISLQIKGIALHTELFSVENGLLTPTMKAKRPELRNYFRSQIDELYSTIKV